LLVFSMERLASDRSIRPASSVRLIFLMSMI
jgi:hypothetical protein